MWVLIVKEIRETGTGKCAKRFRATTVLYTITVLHSAFWLPYRLDLSFPFITLILFCCFSKYVWCRLQNMFSLNFFGPICTKMFLSIICIFAVYFLLSPGKLLLLFPCKFLLPSLYIYFASVYLKMLAPSARKYLYSSTFKILLLSAENAPFQEDYVCFYAVIFTIIAKT